jgi:alanine dehydrogenase
MRYIAGTLVMVVALALAGSAFAAVPQTSSQAICAAILPWVNKLASGSKPGHSWRDSQPLMRGINIEGGKIVHPALQGMKL